MPPRDVVGVDERHRRAPRLAAPFEAQPFAELSGDHRIDGGALPRGAVGRRVGATGEAVGLERRVRVGVEMPLAPPPGRVAELAQQRPPRRKAGVQTAVAGDQAARLVGVQPGEERPARRAAIVGGGVVPFEADGARAQRGQVGHHRRRQRGGRHPHGRAQLVDHDHEDVRCTSPACAPASAAPRAERQAASGEQPLLEEGAPVAGACELGHVKGHL